jgi:hypothetical protein
MNSFRGRAPELLLLAGIVTATLITSYIHWTLGGLLFTLNALGYLGLAALVVGSLFFLQPLRPLVLFGLGGYTIATIVGWLVMGPYFTLAYITKAVEVVLLALIAVQLYRTRTEILPGLRFARALGWEVVRIVTRRPAPDAAAGATADTRDS